MMICSNSPKFGGAPRQTLQFELENVPGYVGSMGLEYVREIASNVQEGKKPFVGADDAIKALEVAEAIYRSANSGSVVELQ